MGVEFYSRFYFKTNDDEPSFTLTDLGLEGLSGPNLVKMHQNRAD